MLRFVELIRGGTCVCEQYLALVFWRLAGGVLTIALGLWHVTRRQTARLKIPYGVAIAVAGLWTIASADPAQWHDPKAWVGPNGGKPHITYSNHAPGAAQ